MRIAVIPTIRDYPWGAPGHCMGELVRVLLRANHDVLWLVAPIDWKNVEVTKLTGEGAKVKVLPDPPPNYIRARNSRRALRRLRGIKTAAEILNDFCPDHVFLNQGGTWCGLRGEFSSCLKSGRYSLIC